MRLYDISTELRSLLEHIAEQEGEVTEADEADLDRLMPTLSDKVARYLEIAREHELEAEALRSEADRIGRRAQVAANAAARLRGRVRDALVTSGVGKVDAGTFRVSLRKGRTSVQVIDATRLPERFVRVVESPDKRAIGDALKAGECVPGAELVEGEPSLSVR